MSFTAIVENGAIKLPPGVHLPDGTSVTVVPPEAPVKSGEESLPTLYEAFKDFVGCVNSGVGDLAENHDHYAHGAPKGIDKL
jgi:hypothetical protein